MRIIQANCHQEIKKVMRDIRVDPYGIAIMAPKAMQYLIRINSVSNITANILKQEMLSLGADVAVCRGALTGKAKRTDCLAMGNLAQFNLLFAKLRKQPFGLNRLAQDLSLGLNNYQRSDFSLNLGRFKLSLGRRALIMGIMNITPDSFSGDGLIDKWDKGFLIDCAQRLIDDGADILDLGGESTRPQANPVSLKEELNRTIPLIKALAKKIKVPISIDTYKPQVAMQALDNGAVMVNDISGLRDDRMARIISRYKAGVVIMHMKGRPATMQKNPRYASLIDEIIEYLDSAIRKAREYAVDEEKIIIDPGIGFGKTLKHNLEILKRLSEFRVLGRPILVGTSRKSFIGRLLDAPPQERINGTVASCVLAVKNGAKIVRVHDVKEVKEALKIARGIENI